jgi:hypothetical protein
MSNLLSDAQSGLQRGMQLLEEAASVLGATCDEFNESFWSLAAAGAMDPAAKAQVCSDLTYEIVARVNGAREALEPIQNMVGEMTD